MDQNKKKASTDGYKQAFEMRKTKKNVQEYYDQWKKMQKRQCCTETKRKKISECTFFRHSICPKVLQMSANYSISSLTEKKVSPSECHAIGQSSSSKL